MMIPSYQLRQYDDLQEKNGVEDGYDYALWRIMAIQSMTLNGGGNFRLLVGDKLGMRCSAKEKTLGLHKTYPDCNISLIMDVTTAKGNSLPLCICWSRKPVVEYYIVGRLGTWRPLELLPKDRLQSMAEYFVYETNRTINVN